MSKFRWLFLSFFDYPDKGMNMLQCAGTIWQALAAMPTISVVKFPKNRLVENPNQASWRLEWKALPTDVLRLYDWHSQKYTNPSSQVANESKIHLQDIKIIDPKGTHVTSQKCHYYGELQSWSTRVGFDTIQAIIYCFKSTPFLSVHINNISLSIYPQIPLSTSCCSYHSHIKSRTVDKQFLRGLSYLCTVLFSHRT